MKRNKLFCNKSLECFKSIFEEKEKFAPIIELVDKFNFLFPETLSSYSRNEYTGCKEIQFPAIFDDYVYLHENFFYGVYEQDKKDKNKYHQIKSGIWERMYDNFLTIANIIKYNEKRKEINFRGYLVTLDNAWSNCCLRIFLNLRSILNPSNIKPEDISIWKIKTLLRKSTNDYFDCFFKCVNFLLDVFKYKTVFKKFVSKTMAHTTSWDIKSLDNDKDLVSLNSAFNLFEGLYIITKIIYYINSNNNPIFGLYRDADNYCGDLLQQEMIIKSSQLYYSDQIQKISDEFALSKIKYFCSQNNIEFNLNKLTSEQKNTIISFILEEMRNLSQKTEVEDYIAYSKLVFELKKKH